MTTQVAGTTPEEADFRAIEAAVMETERGRWFLAEFAHRQRATETTRVLAAIERLEKTLHAPEVPAPPDARPVAGSDSSVLQKQLAEARGRLSEARRIIVRAHAGAHEPGAEDSTADPRTELDAAIAVVKRTIDRIQAVAFELREAGRLGVYADALDAYAGDLGAASARQEAAATRLARLANTLWAVERRLDTLATRLAPAGDGDWQANGWIVGGEPITEVTASPAAADVAWADPEPIEVAETADAPPAAALDADTAAPPPEPPARRNRETESALFLVDPGPAAA